MPFGAVRILAFKLLVSQKHFIHGLRLIQTREGDGGVGC